MGGPLAWMFHSPRRLLTVVVTLLIVLAVVAGIVSTRESPTGSIGNALPESTETDSWPSPDGTLPDPGPLAATPTPEAPPVEALRTARVFVEVWLSGRTMESAAAWHTALEPYVTTALAQGLRNTDPARLPDTKVAGTAQPVQAGEYLAEFDVPLADDTTVTVTTVWDGQKWRVTDIQPGGAR
jgi:hypothetical protein